MCIRINWDILKKLCQCFCDAEGAKQYEASSQAGRQAGQPTALGYMQQLYIAENGIKELKSICHSLQIVGAENGFIRIFIGEICTHTHLHALLHGSLIS